MSFKRNNPGCPCECSDIPCDERCFFKCIGDTCSGICGISIILGEHNTVPSGDNVDSGCPPSATEGCPTDIECFGCNAFDRFFPLSFFVVNPDNPECNDWTLEFPMEDESCWTTGNYSCPYDAIFDQMQDFCYDSGINLSMGRFFPGNDEGGSRDNIGLKIRNTWDGSCGVVTIKIRYTAVEVRCLFEIPIPPPECLEQKATFYEHTFELEYCTCEELLNEFMYVGVTSENSCAGVTIADPCNISSGVVKLRDYTPASADNDCIVCDCYECNGYSGDLLLSIDGPNYTGTITLSLNNDSGDFFGIFCVYRGTLPTEICGPELAPFTIFVVIRCYDCDYYAAYFEITPDNFAYTDTARQILTGRTSAFTCSDSPQFEIDYDKDDDCDFSGYTFSLPQV